MTQMVERKVAFFPVPLGIQLDPKMLHGPPALAPAAQFAAGRTSVRVAPRSMP